VVLGVESDDVGRVVGGSAEATGWKGIEGVMSRAGNDAV